MKSITKAIIIISLLCMILTPSIVSAGNENEILTQSQADEMTLAIQSGFDYIKSQMNADGGIRWIDESSNAAATIRVVIALAAAGYSQDFLTSETGQRPLDYLNENGAHWVYQSDNETPTLNVARAGQLLTAIAAGNQNPHAFGIESTDSVYEINKNYEPNTGIYGTSNPGNVLDQVWAMLGLSAAHANVPETAAKWLISAQLPDGSWDDGYGSYLDTTPLAILALLASGHHEQISEEVQKGISFLKANQQNHGGWQTQWDSSANPNTTGMALQAVIAAGDDPTASKWQKDQGNPITALLSLQQENGAFGVDFANSYSTADAIIALSGQNMADLGFVRKINRSFKSVFAAQESSGGWENPATTSIVILAAFSAGWDPNTLASGGNSSQAYLASHLVSDDISQPDVIGKMIMALTASGLDPYNFSGRDLVDDLMQTYDKKSGTFGDQENINEQIFAILGLYAADSEIPQDAVEYLIQTQNEDGGWQDFQGELSRSAITALALQSLRAVGTSNEHAAVQKGFEFLKSQQETDAGWGDCVSTAFVLMALNAYQHADEDWFAESGRTQLSALLSYQQPNGFFVEDRTNLKQSLSATALAALALLGEDLLINPSDFGKTNRAGLVVDPGNSEVQTACIQMTEKIHSGLDLLQASGFAYVSQDGFMDSILGIKNPEGETFYWSYWKWNGQEWVFNTTGAGETVILPGMIEAWHFTSWERFPSLPPDYIPNLDRICQTKVLKNYQAQPYLSFEDLFSTQENNSSQNQNLHPSQPAETPIRTLVPIFVIGALGLVVIALIVILLLRKHK